MPVLGITSHTAILTLVISVVAWLALRRIRTADLGRIGGCIEGLLMVTVGVAGWMGAVGLLISLRPTAPPATVVVTSSTVRPAPVRDPVPPVTVGDIRPAVGWDGPDFWQMYRDHGDGYACSEFLWSEYAETLFEGGIEDGRHPELVREQLMDECISAGFPFFYQVVAGYD